MSNPDQVPTHERRMSYAVNRVEKILDQVLDAVAPCPDDDQVLEQTSLPAARQRIARSRALRSWGGAL